MKINGEWVLFPFAIKKYINQGGTQEMTTEDDHIKITKRDPLQQLLWEQIKQKDACEIVRTLSLIHISEPTRPY